MRIELGLVLFSTISLSMPWAFAADNSESKVLLLKIDKESLRADLETLEPVPHENKKLGSFPIAIGKVEGDKQKEGDLKTPEGIYFTGGHIKSGIPSSKYGKIAIPINFPNPIDRIDGKSGSGIWLHGAGDDGRMASAQVTEGCVAFFNADILKLKEWIHPHHSLVVIARDLKEVDQNDDKITLSTAVESWISAWKNRDLEAYIDSYSPRMRIDGRGKEQFQNYKRRVFAAYQNMKVNIDEVRIVTHPKYAVTVMNQYFNGDNRFVSNGRKTLYWEKSSAGWKILAESFNHHLIQKFVLPATTLQTAKN